MDEVHKSRVASDWVEERMHPLPLLPALDGRHGVTVNQINPDKAKATVSTRKDGRGDSKYPGWGSDPQPACKYASYS